MQGKCLSISAYKYGMTRRSVALNFVGYKLEVGGGEGGDTMLQDWEYLGDMRTDGHCTVTLFLLSCQRKIINGNSEGRTK